MNVAHVQVIFWIFFDTYEYSVFMYPYFSTKQIRVLSRLRVGVPIRTDILPAYIYAFEYKHDFFLGLFMTHHTRKCFRIFWKKFKLFGLLK